MASQKIGTVRMERNRAIQGAKDMRKTNIELRKKVEALERDAARYRYICDTGTLETAIWEALEGYGCAQSGELDQAAYAAGMDRTIDAAIKRMAAKSGDEP